MAYEAIQKNISESVRVTPTKYHDYDIIDIRIFAKTRDGDVVPTRKGIALNIDQVPALIEALEWALMQPCDEDPDAAPAPPLAEQDAERLASYAHDVLTKHGIAVHWDFAERLILDHPNMRKFSKWHLHYILVKRRDLFHHEGGGTFRAR